MRSSTSKSLSFSVAVLLLSVATVLAACGDDGGGPDAGVGLDASMVAPSRCDVFGGPVCEPTEECFEGACVADACQTDANTCADDELCDMECVIISDPCEGMDCGATSTCWDGECIAGCFPPSPCLGVTCEDGEYCDYGTCRPLNACEGQCPAGQACHIACLPVSPCQDVDCLEDEVCIGGECKPNPCFGVDCADGELCINGECIGTCDGCDCEPYEECVLGECVCEPSCEGKACGDSDGCGGICDACPDNNDICVDQGGGVYQCECNPSCSGKSCGQFNDCGDPCTGGCGAGTCDTGAPSGPVCVCSTGVECGDGDCCAAGATCIDTNGNAQTNSCCVAGRTVCDGPTNGSTGLPRQSCCNPGGSGGNTECIDGYGCCRNDDMCDDLPGECCGGGQRAYCDVAGNVGVADDDFCCRNNAQACQEKEATSSDTWCCPNGQTCYDGPDAEDTLEDTCCVGAAWCEDSKVCCGQSGPVVCVNDDDGDDQNDSCCVPQCNDENGVIDCGKPDGCGGYCNVDDCGIGDKCEIIVDKLDCTNPCPCGQYWVDGQCTDIICPEGTQLCPGECYSCTATCGGPIEG